MSDPWVTYDHIHDPPPKARVHQDRVALVVVMAGVVVGFTAVAVKEVVLKIADRLKRKKNTRP